MKLGIMTSLRPQKNMDAEFKKIRELEMDACQVSCYEAQLYTAENAEMLKQAAAANGVEMTALWAGWSGPQEWNFYGGPETLGLVPKAYRFTRMKELQAASAFAEMLGVSDVVTHAGFLPENPNDPDFAGTVAAIRSLAAPMKQKGQYFLFETGQETPVTLLRTMEAIGTGNLGVNFDTANLVLYGKANPLDALDLLGPYVRNVHIKDGLYPTEGGALGKEVGVGDGVVDFAGVIAKLRAIGYEGPLIIEREHAGDKQLADIIKARDALRALM